MAHFLKLNNKTKFMRKFFLIIFIFTISFSAIKAQNTNEVISKAITALAPTNTYTYSFTTAERINGELILSGMNAKLMQKPLKIYLNNTSGKNKGKELLYVEGKNNNKVLINVAWGFSLNPFSSLVRKGNHYTILDTGFKNVRSILSNAKKRADAENMLDEVFKYEGTVTFDGRKCYKYTITDPTFSYETYTIKNGETLYELAKRKIINEQLIIEKNKNLSGFDSAKDGLVIQIPTSYAKRSVIYIDAGNFHTVYQELYDDKGLFEKYTYKNLVINPKFSADEFTEDFPAYNF